MFNHKNENKQSELYQKGVKLGIIKVQNVIIKIVIKIIIV